MNFEIFCKPCFVHFLIRWYTRVLYNHYIILFFIIITLFFISKSEKINNPQEDIHIRDVGPLAKAFFSLQHQLMFSKLKSPKNTTESENVCSVLKVLSAFCSNCITILTASRTCLISKGLMLRLSKKIV